MNQEIERKFLVDKERLEAFLPLGVNRGSIKEYFIKQSYISTDKERTVRVRISLELETGKSEGFITIKGRTQGISRAEYEYKIPSKDAEELIESNISYSAAISKKRIKIPIGEHTWEVDIFGELNDGLIIAEIELKSEEETFIKPRWVLEEVSEDVRYSNLNLTKLPYTQWKTK